MLFSYLHQLWCLNDGYNSISSRFIRHMHVISIDSFEDVTINKIFTSILDSHFTKGFLDSITQLSKVINNKKVFKLNTMKDNR
jgi:hypothetical protein